MEDGRSSIIIDKLIDMVENGQSVTFSSGKVAVNKDEASMLLKELKSLVEGELKVYREVNDRKGRIINEAKKEADDIIYEAEQTASRIRVTKRMNGFGSGFRADDLDKDEKLALRTAQDIYAASVIYTDEMLTEVTDVVAEAYDIINNQYGRMVSVLEEKARLIADNKAELMSGLRDLSKEDRYSQIMELSQLLANELYNEKNRQKEIEEFQARQMEIQPEEDSAFDMPADYEAESDSAFDMPADYEAESDSAFDVPSDYEPESDSAFVNAVGRETDRKPDAETEPVNGKHDTYVSSTVEKKILETNEVKDTDSDGVKVLRPVDRFNAKKDPVANTLNMFKRDSRDKSGDRSKDGGV
jgi:hypothetical protein